MINSKETPSLKKRIQPLVVILLTLGALVWTLGVSPQPAVHAATIVVTNTNDAGSGSLRQAIANAVSNDTITFGVTGIITLTTGELVVSKNLTLNAPGASALAISGNRASRVINNSAALTLNGLTIRDGNIISTDVGGGILNSGSLTLTNSIVTGNVAIQGGGIYSANGILHITNSTISGNRGDKGDGGGIFSGAPTQFTLSNSTVSGNTAEQNGGGIFASGTANLVNSTISGNSSKTGGGVTTSGNVMLNNVTVTNNSATTSGGGLRQFTGSVTVKNSIIAGNLVPAASPDCTAGSSIASGGYNVLGNNFGCVFGATIGDQVGTNASPLNALLGALQNNGGLTFTHAPGLGSPAIDAGNPGGCTDNFGTLLTADQRGFVRPSGLRCDIGAVELGGVGQSPAITSANTTTFTVGNLGSFNVMATGLPAPTLSMTGTLPSGVTFTASTGVLSGTAADSTGGIYALTFAASNGGLPNVTQNFTLTVNEVAAITSANNAMFAVGNLGSFTVTTRGFPKPTQSISGTLPMGVAFTDNANGTATLSGTPNPGTVGTYNTSITAHNGIGADAVQSFTLTTSNAFKLFLPLIER